MNRTVRTDKPLSVLREMLGEYRAPRLEGLPPFTGGFVGYFAYAMLGYAEPTLRIKRGAWDDFDLMLFDKVIAYDHLKQKIVLIVNMQTDNVLENYGKACASLEAMAALIGAVHGHRGKDARIYLQWRYLSGGSVAAVHEPLCRQPALRVSRAPHHQSLAVHGVPFR